MDNQDITNSVMSTLRQITRAIDLHSKQLAKKYGLTGPQLMILNEIKKTPNLQISDIAKSVSLSQATVTSILDRLCQQGFTIRHKSQRDKRKVNIDLTEKAIDILHLKLSLLQDDFTEQFNKLEEWEKNMLLASLQKLALMMNAAKIQTPPIPLSSSLSASSGHVKGYMKEES